MEKQQNSKRIEWIDVLKGVAIVCVMMGHFLYKQTGELPRSICAWIYSFHMPLFFVLSGLTFSVEKYNGYIEFVIKKVKTLLIPLFSFSIIIMIFEYLFYGIICGNPDFGPTLMIERFIGIFYQGRGIRYESYLWFLSCLFITENIFYFVIKIMKDNIGRIMISTSILLTAGFIYLKTVGILLPWNIEKSFIAVFFVAIGYIIKKIGLEKIKDVNLFAFYILCVINIVSTYYNYIYIGRNIDFYIGDLGNPILFMLQSLSAIFAWIIIANRIKELKWLQFIGKNSLIYYGLLDTIRFIPNIFIYNIIKIDILGMGNASIFLSIGSVVVVSIVLWPVSLFINKKVSFIVGKF